VALLLEHWGLGQDVCLAGLFHSVYGTEHFREGPLGQRDRPRVREVCGERAERLAWRFGVLAGDSLLSMASRSPKYRLRGTNGQTIEVSEDDLADLLAIHWANLLEQRDAIPLASLLEKLRSDFTQSGHLLSDLCRTGVSSALESAEVAPGPHVSAVATLLNLDSPGEFLSNPDWADVVHVVRGPPERLAGLCDYGFGDLVEMDAELRRAVFLDRDGNARSIDLGRGQELAAYEAGSTIYFHGLKNPIMKRWTDALDEELGLVSGLTRVSAFASLPGPGIGFHYDSNDNFVCQGYGSKRWRIAPNTHVRYPLFGYGSGTPITRHHRIEAPRGLPYEMPANARTIEMRPGMVMFVPRGTWHEVESMTEASLHFNVQAGLPTWGDLIDFLASRTSIHVAAELRGPIIGMFQAGRFRGAVWSGLVHKLEGLLNAARKAEVEVQRDEFCRYVALRRTKLTD
jgi:hypothetical protein